MRQFAIELKENLSGEDEADLYFVSVLGDKYFLDETITCEDFEKRFEPFLVRIKNVLDDVLLDADLKPENIDRIIMVGGTSKIPAVNEKVRNYFGKQPQQVEDLTLMVGEGAGIYCGLKYVDKSLNCDISVGVSKNIGLKWRGKFLEMLPQNTLYGTPSALAVINLDNLERSDLSIPVVQGNSYENTKVASIPVPLKITQKLIGGKLGVKLNTDKNNGTIKYELWSVVDEKEQIKLSDGKAEEE